MTEGQIVSNLNMIHLIKSLHAKIENVLRTETTTEFEICHLLIITKKNEKC